jgi:hypothetical protein
MSNFDDKVALDALGDHRFAEIVLLLPDLVFCSGSVRWYSFSTVDNIPHLA